jgi:hypothetical protein
MAGKCGGWPGTAVCKEGWRELELPGDISSAFSFVSVVPASIS